MKICILSDAYENSESPIAPHDLPCDPRRYLEGHECQLVHLKKTTAVRQVIALSRQEFDVFINLCDGAWDEDRPGIEVVQALERLGQAFTGAESSFYEPTREAMKRVCRYWGIQTPGYTFARDETGIERAAATLRFPLIVKHPSSYSSIGLTRSSRVMTLEALREQAWIMIEAFGGALIEEFIDGREFSVLVSENPDETRMPTAYLPVEFLFPEGETFKHFDMKWVDYDGMIGVPCEDPDLIERLKDMSQRMFVGIEGTSYGRCDIRMDVDGELYMLEINPNCGIFYPPESPGSADSILMNDPAGHTGFLGQILQTALRRQRQRQKKWDVYSTPSGGYGMYAAIDFAEGEVIEKYEEEPHFLVTKSYVERNWNVKQQTWFARYAYPMTDETWVMWSQNPEDWKPINHSCDPNAWLEGLNLVARRPIEEGEQITIDYSTFCTDNMESFVCNCGSADCRQMVRGTDYLEPFVSRYGTHISDYVRTKRHQNGHVVESSNGAENGRAESIASSRP